MADGHDVPSATIGPRDPRIGLVPQELSNRLVRDCGPLSFSRGLFGKAATADTIEKVLKDLSLWTERTEEFLTLVGRHGRRS